MQRRILLSLALSAFLLPFLTPVIAQDVQGTWSGTMKMDQYWQGITGTSEKHVTLTILDNIVTGTVTGSAKVTIPGQNGTSTCSGSGTGQLWRVSLNDDGTYDIQGISPKYTCTGSDGSTTEGTEDVLVSSERITNPNSLKGSRTTTLDNSSLGTGNITVTWELNRSIDAQLIIIPENYDTWLPVPGKNEMVAGSTMKVALKLEGRDGKPLNIRSKGFEIKLNNTSKEPGMTINYPPEPKTDLPDIRFLPLPNIPVTGEMQEMDITCNNCLTTTVTLAAFDGGGYTTLTADAILEGNIRIHGSLLQPGGATEIPIPKRDPGKFIAKSWADQYDNPNDNDDKDRSTGNGNDGDGLSAYEEYRGVISRGKFKRLDPEHKNVGIWTTRALFPQFAEGVGLFKRATFTDTLVFLDDEIGQDRMLNKNNKTANIYKQYVLKLVKGGVDGDAIGENRPLNDNIIKTPSLCEEVVIDVDKIKRKYRDQVASLAAFNRENGMHLTIPYTEAENIANTVAHELGHGVGLRHHGPPSDIRNVTVPKDDPSYHVYNSFKQEVFDRPFPIEGLVGIQGNDESGDLNCIMAYTSLYQWVRIIDQSINYYAIPLQAPGKILCSSNEGKGINANNAYFGNGTHGNCAADLKLK